MQIVPLSSIEKKNDQHLLYNANNAYDERYEDDQEQQLLKYVFILFL